MIVRQGAGLALAVLVTVAATGCAPMTTSPAAPKSSATPPVASSAPAATPAESVGVVVPTGTAIDSTTPSPDAQRVLARIPEPLTPAQQALNPATDTSRTRATVAAPAAAYDSLQAAPIPAATQPLGTETSTVTMAESNTAAPATLPPTGSAAAPSAAAGAGAAAASSGTASTSAPAAAGASSPGATSPCWRLQVGAPLESEKEKADARLEAAQSLLVAPFTIVPEKGYLKVRTRDCLTREAADALKKRAVDSGFSDAFLVDTSAPPPAPKPKHQRVPASKRKQ